jgi:type VI secretion system ImpB/VipA family protein
MRLLEDDKIQQQLLRKRPARVQITYDVETGGAIQKVELPFIVGIFSNLGGDLVADIKPAPYKQRQMVEIDRDTFGDVMAASGASVDLTQIDYVLPPDANGKAPKRLSGRLVFSTLDDFAPLQIVTAIPQLNQYYVARTYVRGIQAKSETNDELGSLLDAICDPANTALQQALLTTFPSGDTAAWVKVSATPDIVPVDAAKLSAANVVPQLLGQLLGTAAPAAPDLQEGLTQIGYLTTYVVANLKAPAPGQQPLAGTMQIDLNVANIDTTLSAQVSTIMHAPGFQSLEATWRGLFGLVTTTDTGTLLKLRVFNATRKELSDDLEKAVEFDQSLLFKMIYEAEFGTYGGNPYSLLVGDFEFGNSDDDIEFLNKFTQIAAAAHAPLISAANAGLFGLKDFSQLAKPRDLAKIFEGNSWINWKQFRQTEDSRYATLVLPHVLLRAPYDWTVSPVEGFNFVEDIGTADATTATTPAAATTTAAASTTTPADASSTTQAAATTSPADASNTATPAATGGTPPAAAAGTTPAPAATPAVDPNAPPVVNPDNTKFLWGNAAYSLAQRITNAFSLYRWTASIRGEEGGGVVDGLPLYQYRSDIGSTVLFCPTEVSITDRREKELSDLGFIALCHCKNSTEAVFFGAQTVNQPKVYVSDSANANANLSARLTYMLAASRFAHYIKVIMRKKVGSFMTRGNVESYLQTWISQYILLDDNASQDVKATYPLRAASVIVTEVPGDPGSYKAVLFLRPHFQLEELTTSIRLVADLPKG